jgi:hypothetical protein
MIDTRIENRCDAVNLIAKLARIANRATNACPVSEKEDLLNGLEALKNAIVKEVI